ncbi:AraC family transcriptional regulator [Leucobacter massiliensis]|uniref:AraC family transcriptional regulator n=1 Tax=Leucobacter massiliensis TaxID=1686285 RepID=A0A2S9QSR1_9MICO|nr:AraC family transcriptional regulator [Leucobacter massiliensis]PRI12633.1 AraC family transcriptional regulator [Leucobacter massiliensis]
MHPVPPATPEPPPTEPSSAIVAPHIIRYLVLVAEERGVSLDRALRSVSLSRATLDSPALRVSYRQGRVVIGAALRELGVPALGLLVGARQPITASGVLGLAMMASATLEEAVTVGMRFQGLVGSMVRWGAAREGAQLVVTASVSDDRSPVDRFLVEEGLANTARMAREGAGVPVRVELARPAPPAAEARMFTEHFGSPARFGAGRNAWLVPLQRAREPLPTADRWARAEAIRVLEAQSLHVVARQELVAVLAARIEDALPEVLPLARHAQALATSERTLRRRLADAGSGYAEVLDEVRRSLAERLLARDELTLADVSLRLGYSDERSLRRSVHRWFGTTPRGLRRGSQA